MKRKKVVVATSGGVDSSVAAALLKREGYDVIGIYMKNWSPESLLKTVRKKTPSLEKLLAVCPSERDARDARLVAFKLGIPFYVFNFEQEYREEVIEYFFREYKAGRTPNPDVMCNLKIKFGAFLKKAMALGADFVATGHYARLRREFPISKSKILPLKQKEIIHLLKGVDPNKDQSYFLWTLTQKELQKTLFPIGVYRKEQVRALARDFKLPVAEKKDSQGICFIGEIDVEEFLKTRLPEKSGKVVTTGGRRVGTHQGVWFYTEGQRHGIGSEGGGLPYYVAQKDLKTNTLIVGGNQDPLLFSDTLKAEKVNWVRGEEPLFPLRCEASIRYRQKPAEALVEREDKGEKDKKGKRGHEVLVTFKKPQRAITPGQSIVFYQGEELLGGGIIHDLRTVKADERVSRVIK